MAFLLLGPDVGYSHERPKWLGTGCDEKLTVAIPADINNIYLVYRIHKESGQGFFVILGDPLAEEIRTRVALKYVHPIRF